MQIRQQLTLASALAATLAACTADKTHASATGSGAALAGEVRIDGSSTVFPITEAVAEEYRKVQPKVRVKVGVSGTGGGFKKFCIGETAINDASRPIKGKEIAKAKANKVGFIELPVAFDGITVVINKSNTFVDHLTSAELKKIWEPGSMVKTWSQVRSTWPDKPLALYGPGTDSGTFDYFTEAINGKSHACRPDFTASEDDNVLVRGVAGDAGALGFFGFAYYIENKDKLEAVPIKHGADAPVSPSLITINNGSYKPLSRPIFIYVSSDAVKRAEVRSFVDFYLTSAKSLVEQVGYVALPDEVYGLARKRVAESNTGSVYSAGDTLGKSLSQLYQ